MTALRSSTTSTSWRVWAAVAALLLLYAALALSASTRKGPSYDEGEELAVGYNIWLHHDFRLESANGDFVKRWATLPYLISKPAFVSTSDSYWRGGAPYEVAYEFLFQSGNRAESLLLQGRAMVTLLGIATGLLTFVCTRELFGNCGAFITLALFVFGASMLAFGAMVSTEMSVFLSLLGSTWSVWRLLHRVSWGRLLGSLGFFGLLLLAKPTAVVMLPVTLILLAVKLFAGPPLEWGLGAARTISARLAQLKIFGVIIVLHAVFGWLVIWAHYDFRYAASSVPADPGVVFGVQQKVDPIAPCLIRFLDWSRRSRFLPEGYLHGIQWLLGQNDDQPAFMNGRWKLGGWRFFFPYAMWVKGRPTYYLLLLLGLGSWWWFRRTERLRPPAPAGDAVAAMPTPSFYHAIPYATMAAVYFCIAVMQNLNIGFRHIIPVFLGLNILAGSAIYFWSFRSVWPKLIVVSILLWQVITCFRTYPNFLSYFNPLVGGPAHGYKYLVDSSSDWGMSLPGLRRWLDRNNPGDKEPVFLAYFGTGSPEYYGIKSRRLPGNPDWRPHDPYPLTPGIYAISATLLQGVGTETFGPWNKVYESAYQETLHNLRIYDQASNDPGRLKALLEKYPQQFWENQYRVFEILRFGRLCAWLREKEEPDEMVGYSILIWRLDEKELNEALGGPPAELAEAPLKQ